MNEWLFDYLKEIANNFFDKRGYKLINKKEFYKKEYLKQQLINTTPVHQKNEMPLILALPYLLNKEEYKTFCTLPNKVSLLSEKLNYAMDNETTKMVFDVVSISSDNEEFVVKEILSNDKNKLSITSLIISKLCMNNLFFEMFNAKIDWESSEIETIVNYLGPIGGVKRFLNEHIISGVIPIVIDSESKQIKIEVKLGVI